MVSDKDRERSAFTYVTTALAIIFINIFSKIIRNSLVLAYTTEP